MLLLAFCNGCGGGGASSASPAAPSAPPAVSAPAPVNHAPTIAGEVVTTARVGETYVWQPVAADVDGDTLHFTAVNLPPWASMDPTNGYVTGTPGETDVGIYESITITVADAQLQSATAPFSITVEGNAGSGVASLQWETPPSKVDGSPLDDLAGYRILYGRSSEDLDQSVLIDNPAATTFEFNSLASGVWYFAVVAVNVNGLEGPPTTVATKSI
ncbi:MAG TPA: putative Ig domain-containing protein [Steroidobacteraceae bacterium]|nr:putative Ig domain-containing protein [Steroidobacteraceae bacterium]